MRIIRRIINQCDLEDDCLYQLYFDSDNNIYCWGFLKFVTNDRYDHQILTLENGRGYDNTNRLSGYIPFKESDLENL